MVNQLWFWQNNRTLTNTSNSNALSQTPPFLLEKSELLASSKNKVIQLAKVQSNKFITFSYCCEHGEECGEEQTSSIAHNFRCIITNAIINHSNYSSHNNM